MGLPIGPLLAPGYTSHPVFPIIHGHPRFFKREASASADPQYIVPGLPPPLMGHPPIGPLPLGSAPVGPLPLGPLLAPGYTSHPIFPIIGGHPRFFKREASATSSEPYAFKTKVENPKEGTKYQVDVQVDGHGNGQSFQQVKQTEKVHLTGDDTLFMAQRQINNRNKVYQVQDMLERNMNRNTHPNNMIENRGFARQGTMDNRDMLSTFKNMKEEGSMNMIRHHQNMMENNGRIEQLMDMDNRLIQTNPVNNREMFHQRYSLAEQNRLMQEMNDLDRQSNIVMDGRLSTESQRMSPRTINHNIMDQRNRMVSRMPTRTMTRNNEMNRSYIVDNRDLLDQRTTMVNQNMRMQEMSNAQHPINAVEQGQMIGGEMTLTRKVLGQLRAHANTGLKRNSYN